MNPYELPDPRDQHRPPPEGVRLAIAELYRQGLKARDIAGALRLELPEVIEALAALGRGDA